MVDDLDQFRAGAALCGGDDEAVPHDRAGIRGDVDDAEGAVDASLCVGVGGGGRAVAELGAVAAGGHGAEARARVGAGGLAGGGRGRGAGGPAAVAAGAGVRPAGVAAARAVHVVGSPVALEALGVLMPGDMHGTGSSVGDQIGVQQRRDRRTADQDGGGHPGEDLSVPGLACGYGTAQVLQCGRVGFEILHALVQEPAQRVLVERRCARVRGLVLRGLVGRGGPARDHARPEPARPGPLVRAVGGDAVGVLRRCVLVCGRPRVVVLAVGAFGHAAASMATRSAAMPREP